MPFPRLPSKNQKTVGKVTLSAFNLEVGGIATLRVSVAAELKDASGTVVDVWTNTFDVESTSAQKTSINNLLDNIRTKLQSEIVPI